MSFLVIMLFSATALKLNGSSIGSWNLLTRETLHTKDTLLGTPKLIRVDEWSVTTPAILSQLKGPARFATANESWGPDHVPLILSVPVRHWSMLFRPQYWGFFLVEPERAFAFYWNMKMFLLVGGVFLLMRLLTAGNFWISVLAAVWVLSSGFVQWWYSTPAMMPEMVGALCLMVVAACTLLESASRSVMVAMAILFIVAFVAFETCCYPPFQVPLLYLGLAVTLGRELDQRSRGRPGTTSRFRLVLIPGVIFATVLLSWLWFRDVQSTLALVRATSYPGGRVSTGGDVSVYEAFGGFFGFFMSEESFPVGWLNVCEASNFVLLFPITLVCMASRVVRKHRLSCLQGALAIYVLAVLSWTLWGWPRSVAAVTAFRYVPGRRALLGLGLASIFLCCTFLAGEGPERRPRMRLPYTFLLGATLVVALGLFSLRANLAMRGLLRPRQVLLVALLGAIAGVCLAHRRAVLLAACVLIPNMIAYGLVNPLTRGLGPLTGTRLFREVSEIVTSAPEARWVAYGESVLANYLKAAGARVLNGTNVVPPFQDLRVLDPNGSYAEIYNRYAHMALVPRADPRITFTLTASDKYVVGIDPASECLVRLGVRYVVLPFENTDERFAAKSKAIAHFPESGIWIYELRHDVNPAPLSRPAAPL